MKPTIAVIGLGKKDTITIERLEAVLGGICATTAVDIETVDDLRGTDFSNAIILDSMSCLMDDFEESLTASEAVQEYFPKAKKKYVGNIKVNPWERRSF